MSTRSKVYLVGGGIGSLAAATFMIRDGNLPGENIFILEAATVMGGSLDGTGDPVSGYSLRGGRMLTTDNYECTWDLFKSIPSLNHPGKSVFEETVEFNQKHKAHSMARLVDKRRAKVPVTSMGFSMQDRLELLKLSQTDEDSLGASCITDWLSPRFFETEFWYMWCTTFAFQPWHSAVEFKRYLVRFAHMVDGFDRLNGIMRTVYNQYDSMVRPLQKWLEARDVKFELNTRVTDLGLREKDGELWVTGIAYDSRRVGPGIIFVAIRGQNMDGHQFISNAIDRGAAAFVCLFCNVAESSLIAPGFRRTRQRCLGVIPLIKLSLRC